MTRSPIGSSILPMLVMCVLVAGLVLAALAAPTGLGKVVNENREELPPGCEEVSEQIEITVRGGTEFASEFDGVAFTFEQRSWDVPSCAQITVTFVNTDPIRHQFMIHGTYPSGSTLIELPGEGEDTATWIAPSSPTSLMVHCGVNQHQQKGMKAQFLIDGGDGDVPNIPGISGLPQEDRAKAHAHAHDHHHPHDHEASADEPAPAPGPGAAVALLGLLAAGLIVQRRRS